MRRLCTMNPSFAQSIIEDYIRPQVRDRSVPIYFEALKVEFQIQLFLDGIKGHETMRKDLPCN